MPHSLRPLILAGLLAAAPLAHAAGEHDHGSPAAAKPAAANDHEHHCPMMEGGMMGGKGMGGMMKKDAGDASAKRIEQLEKRVDLLQAALESLLRRQGGTSARAPR